MEEDPNCFVNYWGQGRVLIGLGQFQAAAKALHTALEKAPEGLQPPASEEIPELLRQCQESAQAHAGGQAHAGVRSCDHTFSYAFTAIDC
jgi:hypothetical protein